MSTPGEPVAVRTADGPVLSAHWHDVPAGTARRGALLLMPAIATPARTLVRLATALTRCGWAVLRADYRFTGASRPQASRRHDASMADLLEQDVPALLEELARRAPGVPHVSAGHSLGGHLSALALARFPERVRAAVMLNAAIPRESLWTWPDKATVALAFRLFPSIATLVGHLPERPLGLGTRMPGTLIREWGRWGRHGHYRAGRLDLAQVLGDARGPLLCVGAVDDTVYVPLAATQAYLAMMPHAVVTSWTLSPAEVGVRRLGHFGLVRSPEAAAGLARRVTAWLDQAVQPAAPENAR